MNSRIVRKPTRTAQTVKAAAVATRKATVASKSAQPAPLVPKPKHKLVRDSFTIPKIEYAVLEALKLRAAALARPVKKSELLRAGVAALNGMSDKAFLSALNAVPSLKTGRPAGTKTAAPATQRAK